MLKLRKDKLLDTADMKVPGSTYRQNWKSVEKKGDGKLRKSGGNKDTEVKIK